MQFFKSLAHHSLFFHRHLNTKAERGSSFLLALASTFGGLLFVLLFVNFVRYVTALGAIQDAAIQTTRCASPTDGDCTAVTYNSETTSERNWYGFPAATIQVSAFAKEAAFEAEVQTRVFDAEFSSYEVLTGNQNVRVQEKQLPVKRYVFLLNSFAHNYADLEGSFVNPADGTSTPLCSARNAAYIPRNLLGHDLSQQIDNPTDPRFIGNDQRWCQASPELRASCGAGSDWPVASCSLKLPFDSTGESPWLLLGGTPVCEGEASEGAPPRLEDASLRASEPGERNFPVKITNSRQFLVVEVAACNEASVLAKLQAVKTADDLAALFSTPSSISEPRFNSPHFNHPGSAFVYNNSSLITEYDWTYLKWQRTTNDPSRDTYIERKVCALKSWDEAVASWPELLQTHTRGYQSPGSISTNNVITVADAPATCGEAIDSADSPVQSCTNRSVIGSGISDLRECEGLNALIDAREHLYSAEISRLASLNQQQNFAAFFCGNEPSCSIPVTGFSTIARPKITDEYINQRWIKSWTNSDTNGVAYPQSAIRKTKHIIESAFRKLKKQSAPYFDEPSNEEIALLVSQTASLLPHHLGFATFSENPKQYVSLASTNVSETIKHFNTYTVGGIEILPYWGQQGIELGFDYDLDCSVDESCSAGTKTFGSLEEALRSFAANASGYTELLDESYEFNWHRLPPSFGNGEVLVTDAEGNLSSQLPACTPVTTKCTRRKQLSSPILISAGQNPPSACTDGQYENCFAVASSTIENGSLEATVDEATAREIAIAELERSFPGGVIATCQNGSKAAGCAFVVVNYDNVMVDVEVIYNMAVSFPLSEILGRDSVPLKYTTKERREIVGTL